MKLGKKIKNQIEEEINNLLGELQVYEDVDPAYLTEELKELRH